jgi:hypothetical protein
MRKMIRLSLLLNIAVLIPVCTGLLVDASWVAHGVRADPILTHPADPILTRGWTPTA